MEEPNDRPLGPIFQDAEDAYNGKLLIIERAAGRTQARSKFALVLRWYLDHYADKRPVVAEAKKIAASVWIDVSERTVQRANAHWKKLGVLAFFERRDDNGTSLPPWASLNWGTVLKLAGVQSPGTVPAVSTTWENREDRRELTCCDGPLAVSWQPPGTVPASAAGEPSPGTVPAAEFSGEGDRQCTPCQTHPPLVSDTAVTLPGDQSPSQGDQSPSPGDQSPSQGDQSPSLPLPAEGVTPRVSYIPRTCACVRQTCTDTDTDDDVSIRSGRGIDWPAVQSLAERETARIWPSRGSPAREAWIPIRAWSVLALYVFNEEWLSMSIDQVIRRRKKGDIREFVPYLAGVVRENVWKCHFIEDEPPQGRKSWFGALMWPIEQTIVRFLPPPPERLPPRTPSPSPESQQTGWKTGWKPGEPTMVELAIASLKAARLAASEEAPPT